MRFVTTVLVPLALVLGVSVPARAQQRPLVTEDPETIGAGRLLVEMGVDYGRNQKFPVSGLTGNLWTVPTLGVSIGISSIAEIQIDGGPYQWMNITMREPGPLASEVTAIGTKTDSVTDLVVATKLRLVSETATRPSFGIRLATKLPTATNESGLGLDTMDFHASLLAGKTTASTRLVVNAGLGILGDPTQGDRQTDVLLYGLSLARAVRTGIEVVAEANGRLRLSGGDDPTGGEHRTIFKGGARYTFGPGRLDAAVLVGATSSDPDIGFTVGYTHVFNAFNVP